MLTQRSFFLNFVATITLILSATSSHALSPAVDGENNPTSNPSDSPLDYQFLEFIDCRDILQLTQDQPMMIQCMLEVGCSQGWILKQCHQYANPERGSDESRPRIPC